MKVTKAKGLNIHLTCSSGYKPMSHDAWTQLLAGHGATLPAKSSLNLNQFCSWFAATAASQIVLSPFALVTFIWGRK
jgi:hypothetical protein